MPVFYRTFQITKVNEVVERIYRPTEPAKIQGVRETEKKVRGEEQDEEES